MCRAYCGFKLDVIVVKQKMKHWRSKVSQVHNAPNESF